MKNILKIITLLLFTNFCTAQSPIINILNNDYEFKNGAYYKDIDNLLNRYEGTWVYTNGNTSFTLKLKKKLMMFNGFYYSDGMVGGYQYIENGIEKINFLSDYDANYSHRLAYKASGDYILRKIIVPSCDECADGELRLMINIKEPNGYFRDLVLRFKLNFGSPNQITFKSLGRELMYNKQGDPPPANYILPNTMNFTLEKQ